MHRIRGVAFLLTVPATACVVADEASRTQTETLPGGGVHVVNTGTPEWTAETEWRLREDLRLGGVDDGGPEQFGRIAAIQTDARGRIYVLDALSQDVRVFEPDGRFSHRIGGPGEGPGELTLATGMAFGPSGSLWVMDARAGRYSAFAQDGEFLASYRRRIQSHVDGWPGAFTDDGRYFDWGLAFPDERPGIIAGSRVVFQPFRLGHDFTPTDTLPALEFRQAMVAEGTRPQIFFDARLALFQDGRDGIWFANTGEYRVLRRTLEGDTTLVFTLPAEAVRIGEAERAEVRARFADRPDAARDYLEALPDAKPVIVALFGDRAGRVYIVPELAGVPAGSVVDVFGESGTYLGRLDLPVPMRAGSGTPVVHATADHLYYVHADELEMPRIARVAIERPGDSAADSG